MGKTKIRIDYSKCTAPEKCKQCLGVCQPAVLILTFSDKNFYDPKEWKIFPAFPGLCIGCGLCVSHCPENAISVKVK